MKVQTFLFQYKKEKKFYLVLLVFRGQLKTLYFVSFENPNFNYFCFKTNDFLVQSSYFFFLYHYKHIFFYIELNINSDENV